MTTVLVHHNTRWRTEQEARDAWPSAAAVRREVWWNLWKTRQEPYKTIADGSLILLLDSWPGRGGVLSWLVRARDVRTQVLPDKNAAIRSIAGWTGWSRREVLGNPYTADRPADAGHVIFWRADPIARLDVVHPPQLAVRRNGWLVTDDVELKSWGVTLPVVTARWRATSRVPEADSTPPGRWGRGPRRLDVAARRAIERRAMTEAKAWCRHRGWTSIQDVSARSPRSD